MSHGNPPDGHHFGDHNLYRLDELTGSLGNIEQTIDGITDTFSLSGQSIEVSVLDQSAVGLMTELLQEIRIIRKMVSISLEIEIEPGDVE